MIKTKIFEKKSLSKFSTIKIGGIARFLALPENLDEIYFILDFCKKNSLKPFFFGLGANILFSDKIKDYICFVSLKNFCSFNIEKNYISFDSGFPVSLVPFLGLPSLFFLYLLPGTIGAAVYMNVKYDKYEIGPYISKIIYLDLQDLNIKEIGQQQASFSYKSSIFQNKNWIILKVFFDNNLLDINLDIKDIDIPFKKTFESILKKYKNESSDLNKFYQLFKINIKNIIFYQNIKGKYEDMMKIEQYRISKNHFKYPSCGSVFKNNYSYGVATGALVDQLGLKGFKHNDAQIAPYHGNIIINLNKAKASDVIYLINLIQEKINNSFGFIPEPEIIIFDRLNY